MKRKSRNDLKIRVPPIERFTISQNTEPTRKGSKDIEFTLSFYIQSSLILDF